MNRPRDILATIDLARLILSHWMDGVPVDQKAAILAARLNRARRIIDLNKATLAEEDVPPCWDVALSLAKFTAFSLDLKIPATKDGSERSCA